ncbi:redoxin domain-containing protein [Streptomyces sp. NPDC091287]|uniref:redoxin domain-containing protein n=1 Tax=Streptomyces sp. NPDC091287 TaxID=3365988 RepID=UPI003828C281
MRARTVLPALLVAALFALTGCGADSGDDDEPTGASPPGSSSAGQPTASPDAGSDGTTAPVVPQALRFTATTVDGKPFQADALAGKPTVLWFWAPWCPKCKAQATATAKVAADYAGRANVVGVAGMDKNEGMKDLTRPPPTPSSTPPAPPNASSPTPWTPSAPPPWPGSWPRCS